MLSWKAHRFAFFIPIFIVVLAVTIRRTFWYDITDDILRVIKYLARVELSFRPLPQRQPGPHVLVGFGGCVDLKIRALTLLSALRWHPPNADELLGKDSPDGLTTESDVMLSLASSFVSGTAMERVIHNETIFKLLVDTAAKLVPERLKNQFLPSVVSNNHPYANLLNSSVPAYYSLGGNAPLMAGRLAREGAEVYLAARLSQRQRTHLPNNVKVLTAPAAFGLPDVPLEDIHLILEFDAGEKWGDLIAPRANRFIVLRDQETSRLSGLWPGLLNAWEKASRKREPIVTPRDPHPALELVVVGGLQVMDHWGPSESPDIRMSRLDALASFLSGLSSETLVHFEMASFINRAFVTEVIRKIMPHVDSIGANEQELPNLASLLYDGSITSVSPAYPRAAHMLDTMRSVWALLTDPHLPRVHSASGHGWRHLSRIHLHTLAYQIIMVRRHKNGGSTARAEFRAALKAGGLPVRRTDIGLAWPFNRAAVAKASLIAHRHTCAASSVDPLKTRLLMDDSFAVTADQSRWQSALRGSGEHYIQKNRTAIPRIHFNISNPVTCWTEPEPDLSGWEDYHRNESPHPDRQFDTVVEICISPVLVCSAVRQTVGAGDNISAGALRAQIVVRGKSD